MGGSSRSESSQSTSNTTEVNDSRVGVEAGGIGVGQGGVLTLTTTDFGLIEAGGDVLARGLDNIGKLGKAALDTAVSIVVDSNAAAVERNESIGQDLAKYYVRAVSVVIVIITLAAAVIGFRRSKK